MSTLPRDRSCITAWVIEQERVVRLAGRDALVFVKALEKPLPPNRKLAAALANYTKRRHDHTGTIDWAPRSKRVLLRS